MVFGVHLIFNMGSSVMYVCKKSKKKKGYTDSVCTDSLDIFAFEVFNLSIDMAVIHE